MHSSCVAHPNHDTVFLLRAWHVETAQNNYPIAVCLAVFDCHAHGLCLELPYYVTPEMIAQRCLLLYSPAMLREALEALRQRGLVDAVILDSQEAMRLCAAKGAFAASCGLPVCQWCGGATWCLQTHHYPVPRAQHGKETVDICANCHAEWHYLVATTFYTRTPALDDMIAHYRLSDKHVARLKGGQS